ncbi:MAG: aminotransferase class V-fold PLP-dependent enzyme [Syntrophobacteraceae bacterium]|jgi:cysteine desulfurase family protein|nr:aminotransferase class V-fold PLP-dependent enzyme [Syntrophobacteraceae bacterium]
MTLYLDNAATSWPKPPSVHQAVKRALEEIGASPGRAAHRMAREAERMVEDARRQVADLFHVPDPRRVIFTRNATESINVVLRGWLRPGDRVLMSSLEHNAVARPLRQLETEGVLVERIPLGSHEALDLQWLRERMEPPPRLVVLVHASNVTGELLPVAEAAQICRSSGAPLLLDAAQTAGLQNIDVEAMHLGMLACSGHKALLGPAGVGILYIRSDLAVDPLIRGGTGSRSEELEQPDACPDRFESGTVNLPGIAGLAAGIAFIREKGMDSILAHELHLAALLEAGLGSMPGVQVLKPQHRGTGVVSFRTEELHPADIGFILDEVFDIAVRTGLHCAPLAHRALGSFPGGTVRISPGYASTESDIERMLQAMATIAARRA